MTLPAETWTQRIMTDDARLWVASDDSDTLRGVVFANPQDVAAKYNARQYQTNGSGTSWVGGNRRPLPAQLSIPVFIHGPDMGAVNRAADTLSRLMLHAQRYYIGGRFVTVLGCSEINPTRGRGGLTRDVTYVLNLKDPYWRLSDDDLKPTVHPIESDMALSLYPLGLFKIFSETPGAYTLDPLGGTTTAPSSYTYQIAGQDFTLKTLEVSYDSPYL